MIDNSMYHIPNTNNEAQQELQVFLESTAPEKNRDYIDFLSETEEKLVAPVNREELPHYDEIKQIEQHIESMRLQTKPVDVARYELYRVLAPLAGTLAPTTNEDFERRIMDIESEIGGGMLPRDPEIAHQRFWFDHNGHWFYEVRYKSQPNVPSVVHYHIMPHVMTKTTGDARVVPYSPGESEALLLRIRQYHEALMEKFYGKQSDYALAS